MYQKGDRPLAGLLLECLSERETSEKGVIYAIQLLQSLGICEPLGKEALGTCSDAFLGAIRYPQITLMPAGEALPCQSASNLLVALLASSLYFRKALEVLSSDI